MSAENFGACLAFVLAQEGGFVDLPDDNGRATNKGITLRTLQSYQHGATVEDLKTIPDSTVSGIYQNGYWWPIDGDSLPAGVDLSMFDFAVNSGPRRAIMELQLVLGLPGDDVDGKMGPVTWGHVYGRQPTDLITKLGAQQAKYYRSLPTFHEFGRGWLARNERRIKAALVLLATPPKEPT